jgi:adenosylhomocysteine nucleosidase
VRRIAILAALDREIRGIRKALLQPRRIDEAGLSGWSGLVGRIEVILIRTGMGAALAGPATRQVLTRFSPEAILSIGFACALHPNLVVGDLILSKQVARVSPDGVLRGPVIDCDPSLRSEVAQHRIYISQSGKILEGLIVSVDRVFQKAHEKEVVANRQQGALALDMESAIVAECATEAKVPFLAVRAVSDLLDEDLGIDFERFLQPDGSFRIGSGVYYLLTHPKNLHRLNRLRRQSSVASRSLDALLLRYLRHQSVH